MERKPIDPQELVNRVDAELARRVGQACDDAEPGATEAAYYEAIGRVRAFNAARDILSHVWVELLCGAVQGS